MSFVQNYTINLVATKFAKVANSVNKHLESIENHTKKASHSLEKFGMHMSAMAHRMLIPVAGMTLALREGMKAADMQIVSLQTMRSVLGGNLPIIKDITEASEKLEGQTRFTQEAYLDSAKSIVQYTHSGQAALIALKPLANLATLKHTDLQTITGMFNQSLTGTTNLLAKYSIVIDTNLRGKARELALIKAIQKVSAKAAYIAGHTGLGPLIRLVNQVGAAWKHIALKLFPLINPVIEKIIVKFKSLQEWMSKHKKTAQAIGIILAGFITLSAVVLSLSLLVTGLSMVFGVLSGAFSGTLAVLLNFGWAIKNSIFLLKYYATTNKIVTAVTKATTIAVKAMGVALKFLATTPLGIVITMIGLLVTGLIYAYKHSAKFRAIVDDLGKILMHVAKVAIKAVADSFKWLWSKIKPIFDLWLKYMNWVWGLIKKVGHFFGKIFHAAFNKMKSDLHEIGNTAEQVAGKVQRAMDKKVNKMGMFSAGDEQMFADVKNNKLMFAATHQHEMSLNEKMFNAMQGNNQQVHVHIHPNDEGGFSHYISPFANGSTPTISVPNTSN